MSHCRWQVDDIPADGTGRTGCSSSDWQAAGSRSLPHAAPAPAGRRRVSGRFGTRRLPRHAPSDLTPGNCCVYAGSRSEQLLDKVIVVLPDEFVRSLAGTHLRCSQMLHRTIRCRTDQVPLIHESRSTWQLRMATGRHASQRLQNARSWAAVSCGGIRSWRPR